MRPFQKKFISALTTIHCLYILMWRCTAVIFSSLRNNMDHRSFVNRFAMLGARRMLTIIKANYKVEYAVPLQLDNKNAYIFMSNHQSLFDIPLIYATVPGTIRFVTKAELFHVPLFGRALKVGECVPVHRRNPAKKDEFIQIAKDKLANGVSLWIFPEGTRSRNSELLPFKSGGFHLAKDTATKIVPVAIVNTRAILPPKKVGVTVGQTVAVRVGEPIDPSGYDTPELQVELMGRVRGEIERLNSL